MWLVMWFIKTKLYYPPKMIKLIGTPHNKIRDIAAIHLLVWGTINSWNHHPTLLMVLGGDRHCFSLRNAPIQQHQEDLFSTGAYMALRFEQKGSTNDVCVCPSTVALFLAFICHYKESKLPSQEMPDLWKKYLEAVVNEAFKVKV